MSRSTGSPDDSATMHQELGDIGVRFVDVAVSGGPAGANKGILTAMVGGEPEAVRTVRPLIDTFAREIVHLGPAGKSPRLTAAELCGR